MKKFTKDQLIARINQVTAINKYRISQDPEADGLVMNNELFAIALAALTAEPVCYLNRFTGRTFTLEQQPGADKDTDVYIPLYIAQPAPVLPVEISDIIKRFQYQADHLSDWHHIDEHSCKVNRRDLMTVLEFMSSCRTAMSANATQQEAK